MSARDRAAVWFLSLADADLLMINALIIMMITRHG